jgi:hypothetical protein
MRPYTGFDGNVKGPLPSMNRFIDYAVFLTGGGLWNNGAWGVRPKRGKSSESVHGTGRAVDLSWRKMPSGRGRQGFGDYNRAKAFIDFVVANADTLEVEIVLDYFGKPHGQGWRCDRGFWQQYTSRTIGGAPGGDWFHCEISPRAAADPTFYDAAFKKALGL